MNVKKLIVRIIFLGILMIQTTALFSQTTVFKNVSFEEACKQAQKEKKHIFLDVYTDWCGPCKWMDKEVFSTDSFALLMQEQFICLKMNAEKGEGIEIKEKYNVEAYPSLLFINADGQILHKVLGKKNFQELKAAVKKASNPKFQIPYYTQKFEAGQRDTAFLYDFAMLLRDARQDAREISGLYLDKVGKEQWTTDKNFYFLTYTQRYFDSPYFRYVADHKNDFKGKVSDKLLNWLFKVTLYDAIYDITGKQDPKLRKQLIQDMRRLLPVDLSKKLISRFKSNYAFFQEGRFANTKRLGKRDARKYGNPSELNAVAWNIFENKGQDTHWLKYGLWLVNESIKGDHNAYSLDTKARILHKLGRYKEALAVAKEAADLAKKEKLSLYDDLLKLIKELEGLKS